MATAEPLLAEGEPLAPSPIKALTDFGGSVGRVVLSPVTATGKVAFRGGSELASVVTTGKFLTTREAEAAIKMQAIARGNQTRDKIAAEKSSLFCINNRKASKEDDSSWLCGCTGRGKKTKIPKDGMPGIARSPSFPRKEDFDKAKEEKM